MPDKIEMSYAGQIFSRKAIHSCEIHTAQSLTSSELTADTLEIIIESEDASLAAFEKNAPLTLSYQADTQDMALRDLYGRILYTREGLPIVPRLRPDQIAGDRTYHFYVQEIKRIAKQKYQFSAQSAIGLLLQSRHYGGIYTGQTLYDVVLDICGGTIPFILKSDLQFVRIYGYLPIATRRDNLSEVLFATGASVRVDFDGVLRIEGLLPEQTAQIGKGRMFTGGAVEYGKPVSHVSVTEHQYIEASSTEDTVLFDGVAVDGDIIEFSDPCYDIKADGLQIYRKNANYAVIGSGTGKLTGKKYLHTTRTIMRTVDENAADNMIPVSDATLVTLVNSMSVARRLAEYYACPNVIANDIVARKTSPGDVTGIYDPYDETDRQGCMEEMDTTFSSFPRASAQIRVGYMPMSIDAQEYYNTRILLTQSSQFVIPEGVTNIRAVLIGPGQGGAGGACGERGGTGEQWSEWESKGYIYGAAGAGGAAGQGGAGGKIYITDLAVFPGQIFPAVIGKGGTGGTGAPAGEAAAAGHAGTPTQFGSLSSESGSSSDGGYIDLISGIAYGARGGAGTDGGAGSGVGDEVDDVAPGPSVAGYQPGAQGETARSNGSVRSRGYGGCGGGAAVGSNGADGGDGSVNGVMPTGGAGGKGADASDNLAIPAIPGTGGFGGHGGGGGGGGGAAIITGSGTYVSDTTPGVPGQGGSGGAGGKGADGCILIYYHKATTKTGNGILHTCDGVKMMDRYARLIAV